MELILMRRPSRDGYKMQTKTIIIRSLSFTTPKLYHMDDPSPSLLFETNSRREPKYQVPTTVKRPSEEGNAQRVPREAVTIAVSKNPNRKSVFTTLSSREE
jgi:hypothetical protein